MMRDICDKDSPCSVSQAEIRGTSKWLNTHSCIFCRKVAIVVLANGESPEYSLVQLPMCLGISDIAYGPKIKKYEKYGIVQH